MPPRTTARAITIGALLRSLQEEFPDVTVSKIRFLEAEGLVTPGRTPAGYRVYTAADAERLHYVLTAQRDRFWPLKVIKEALDAIDRGLTPPGGDPGERPAPPSPAPDPGLPTVAELTEPRRLRLTARELAQATGTDVATVESLASYGLIAADDDGHYDDTALAVTEAAGRLAAYGMEPRHLRTFRNAADREVGLVEQALAPLPGDAADRRRREAEVLQVCLALHTALVKAGLRGHG